MEKCAICKKSLKKSEELYDYIDKKEVCLCAECYQKKKEQRLKKLREAMGEAKEIPVIKKEGLNKTENIEDEEETPIIENYKSIKLKQIGAMLLLIGTVFLIFGLTTENWIKNEGNNSFFRGENYDFWVFLSNLREVSIPLSIILIVLGLILFIIPYLFTLEDGNILKNTNIQGETTIEILKKRYAKGEITKTEFEQMKKDIED